MNGSFFNKFPWTNLHGFNLDWVINTIKELKAQVDSYGGFVSKDELTNQRKLDESGNFTGTWEGDSKSNLDSRIDAKLDKTGNFSGTWEGENKTQFKSSNWLGTWEGESKNAIDNRITFGDFLGTWEGETKNSVDSKIQNSLTLYNDVVALINANPNIGFGVTDGGFLGDGTTPSIIDGGLIADAPIAELDGGAILQPCICA